MLLYQRKYSYCLLPILYLFVNCQRTFDAPPPYTGPSIKGNITIAAVKAMHNLNGFERISDELIIDAVVVGNDKQDNLYKTLMIQDSTAGISLRLDGYSLFSQYPIGQRVFVRLKGLWMSDYGGMVQLGGSMDRTDPTSPQLIAIPQPIFNRIIIKGNEVQDPPPKDLVMGDLHDGLQGMLIRLHQVEFAAGDTARSFADVYNQATGSRSLRTCTTGTVYVRTTGFSRFAHVLTPRGNGTITGLYSVFRNQKQLLLRDTGEIKMDGLRCSVLGPKLLLSGDLQLATNDSVLQLPNWQNISETGHRPFQVRTASGKRFAEVGAFATREPVVISWLILPPIDMDRSANEVLRFSTKDGFDNGAVLQVLASTNYDGGPTPWKARWNVLDAQVSKGNINAQARDWVRSGDVSLSGFKGKLYIAFRYEGGDPPVQQAKQTTTYRIADIEVWGN